MHQILALLRHIHRELYLLGPAIVPAVLSKYRMECGAGVCLLCLAAAGLEMLSRRWSASLLWIASGGLLMTGLIADSRLWGTHTGAEFGAAAIGAAGLGVLVALGYLVQAALREARRERREYRRIPGSSPARMPGAPATREPSTRRY